MPSTEFQPSRLAQLVEGAGGVRKVAGRLPIDPSDLSRYCNGKTMPGADRLAAILSACDATWADLGDPKKSR